MQQSRAEGALFGVLGVGVAVMRCPWVAMGSASLPEQPDRVCRRAPNTSDSFEMTYRQAIATRSL